MRRRLISALAVPVLALAACGGDGEEVTPPASDSATQSSAAPDAAETTTEDMATESSAPPADDSMKTSAPGGDAMGGADGEQAAGRAKDFLVALVQADPKLCEMILNFDSTAPMAESPEDLTACEEELIPPLEQQMDGLLSEEDSSAIESLEINGAMVEGDTATITEDNFSGALGKGFARGFNKDIMMQRIDDEWYVDFVQTFGP